MSLYEVDIPEFQFHKGTIKTLVRNFTLNIVYYFNSIKVRLKLTIGSLHVCLFKFQFHKGTIKTQEPHQHRAIHQHFNSIKVRLKLCIVCVSYPLTQHFNSIKVRLKLHKSLTLHSHIVFQFHKGTIKTFSLSLSSFQSLYFNSIKVRLKPDNHC